MRARTARRRWWWVAAGGFVVAVTSAGVFVATGPQQRLAVADQLASVGSLLVAVAALVVSAVGVWAALRTGQRRPLAYAGEAAAAAPRDRRLWNVPPPLHTFVGRDDLLHRIATIDGRLILFGQPGVGKTQLASAWAHQRAEVCEIGWWVRAGDPVTVTADLDDLATALGVGHEDGAKAAAAAVEELGRRSRWLLVFDDAVDESAIRKWLPHRGGQILITSRSPAWDAVGTAIEVPALDGDAAAGFLQSRAHDPDAAVAREVAEALGGLPLALEQAGAYCHRTGQSLAGFLDLYRTEGTRLLEHGAPDAYKRGPVPVTVRLTVRDVARRDRAAAQLLYLLAYLAPTAIPRDLAAEAPHILPRPLRQVAADPVRLDQAVRVLIDNALVTPDQPGQLRMHQLVQEILRQPPAPVRWWRRAAWALRLPRADPGLAWSAERWAQTALRLLLAALPTHATDSEKWEKLAALTPHAQALILHADGRGTDDARLETSMRSLVRKMRDIGELDAARQLAEQIVQVRSRLLGRDHSDTLASMSDLAAILSAAGDSAGARKLLDEVVRVRRHALGAEHPDTLASMDDLAAILRNDGRLAGAQHLVEQTLKVRRRVLGPAHPDTVASVQALDGVLEEITDTDAVYADLARRSQALAERMLGMLDEVERDETDPKRLDQLFRIDHIATRMRRNQDRILVFVGVPGPVQQVPHAIVDILRAAASEIESYTRVELQLTARDVMVPAAIVNDLVNLLAELLDNATMFSPPDSVVVVDARRVMYTQLEISIRDLGIGMSEHDLRAANEQIANPQPPHAIRGRLGLPIVGRLAARHRIQVELRAGYEGGVLALVNVPLPGPTHAVPGRDTAVTIPVRHLARSLAFYSDVLGFRHVDSDGDLTLVAIGDNRLLGNNRLVLRAVTGPHAAGPRTVHITLEVADLDAAYRDLTAKGVAFTYGPRPVNRGGSLELWSAAFTDPDGHGIALTQWR